MLYNLVKTYRGKQTVVMTDQLRLVNDYKKKISSSQRKGVNGQRVEYTIVPTDSVEKYKKPPHDLHLSGQPRRSGPKVVGK